MDIQLGRFKTVRRAYGIDEIALVPEEAPSIPTSRIPVELGDEREIPIIASAMDGVVDVAMAARLSELGALGVHQRAWTVTTTPTRFWIGLQRREGAQAPEKS